MMFSTTMTPDHSTPLPNNNDETPDAVLEATPAGITSEEIR
jgi:hypothetical protein